MINKIYKLGELTSIPMGKNIGTFEGYPVFKRKKKNMSENTKLTIIIILLMLLACFGDSFQ